MRFTWFQKLGNPGCEYLWRWVADFGAFSIRLHVWWGPDDRRAPHDHGWDFVTFILYGGYMDVSPSGSKVLMWPSVNFRKAEHKHTVIPVCRPTITLLITGPERREWGFWVKTKTKMKFVKKRRYFFNFGHHQCD